MHKHIKKPMNIAAKTKTNQKTHEHSNEKAQKVKKPMSIAAQAKKPQHCRSRRRRRTSYHSGHQRWETLLPHTPTQLRLARSLARTTRTRNQTDTDFPIVGQLRRLFPLNLR